MRERERERENERWNYAAESRNRILIDTVNGNNKAAFRKTIKEDGSKCSTITIYNICRLKIYTGHLKKRIFHNMVFVLRFFTVSNNHMDFVFYWI